MTALSIGERGQNTRKVSNLYLIAFIESRFTAFAIRQPTARWRIPMRAQV